MDKIDSSNSLGASFEQNLRTFQSQAQALQGERTKKHNELQFLAQQLKLQEQRYSHGAAQNKQASVDHNRHGFIVAIATSGDDLRYPNGHSTTQLSPKQRDGLDVNGKQIVFQKERKGGRVSSLPSQQASRLHPKSVNFKGKFITAPRGMKKKQRLMKEQEDKLAQPAQNRNINLLSQKQMASLDPVQRFIHNNSQDMSKKGHGKWIVDGATTTTSTAFSKLPKTMTHPEFQSILKLTQDKSKMMQTQEQKHERGEAQTQFGSKRQSNDIYVPVPMSETVNVKDYLLQQSRGQNSLWFRDIQNGSPQNESSAEVEEKPAQVQHFASIKSQTLPGTMNRSLEHSTTMQSRVSYKKPKPAPRRAFRSITACGQRPFESSKSPSQYSMQTHQDASKLQGLPSKIHETSEARSQANKVGSKLKLQNRRQIQTVFDSNQENLASFSLATNQETGKQQLIGFIDSQYLSKQEKTQLLNQPKQSFYHHYERPMNKKMEAVVAQEWKQGEARKLYNMMPEVQPASIEGKFEKELQQASIYGAPYEQSYLSSNRGKGLGERDQILEMLSGLQDGDSEVLALKILTIQFQFEQLKEEHIQSDGQGKTKIFVAPQNLQAVDTEMKTTIDQKEMSDKRDELKDGSRDGSPQQLLQPQSSAFLNSQYTSLLMQKQSQHTNSRNLGIQMQDGEQVATIEGLPADSLMEQSVPESEKTLDKQVMPSRLDDKPIQSDTGKPLSEEDLKKVGQSQLTSKLGDYLDLKKSLTKSKNQKMKEWILDQQLEILEFVKQYGYIPDSLRYELYELDALINELYQKHNSVNKQTRQSLFKVRRISRKEAQNSVHLKIQAFNKQKIIQPRVFEKSKLVKNTPENNQSKHTKDVNEEKNIKNSIENYIIREGQVGSVQDYSHTGYIIENGTNAQLATNPLDYGPQTRPHSTSKLSHKRGSSVTNAPRSGTQMTQQELQPKYCNSEVKVGDISPMSTDAIIVVQENLNDTFEQSERKLSKFDYVENKSRMKSAAVRTMTKGGHSHNRINDDMSGIAKNLNVQSSKMIFKKKRGSNERIPVHYPQNKRQINILGAQAHNESFSEVTGATPDQSPLRTRLSDAEPSQRIIKPKKQMNNGLSQILTQRHQFFRTIDITSAIGDGEARTSLNSPKELPIENHFIKSTSPVSAYGFDQKSSCTTSQQAQKQNFGVRIARKMIGDIKNKPCVTYQTERRKNMKPRCDSRFKLLGFSNKSSLAGSNMGHLDQRSILLSSPTNNNVNFRLRSPEDRSTGVIQSMMDANAAKMQNFISNRY